MSANLQINRKVVWRPHLSLYYPQPRGRKEIILCIWEQMQPWRIWVLSPWKIYSFDFPTHPFVSSHSSCKSIHDTTYSLLSYQIVGVNYAGHLFDITNDISPMTLFDKLMIHLLLPCCKVVNILIWERANHLLIHHCW